MSEWELGEAFHPTAFERGVYSVSFRKKGAKYLVDATTRHTQVMARGRKEAIKKARKEFEQRNWAW